MKISPFFSFTKCCLSVNKVENVTYLKSNDDDTECHYHIHKDDRFSKEVSINLLYFSIGKKYKIVQLENKSGCE